MLKKTIKMIITAIIIIFSVQHIVYGNGFGDPDSEGIYYSPDTFAQHVKRNIVGKEENNRRIEGFTDYELKPFTIIKSITDDNHVDQWYDESIPKVVDKMIGKKMSGISANTTNEYVVYYNFVCIDANHTYVPENERKDYQIINIFDMGYSNNGKSVDVYKYYNKNPSNGKRPYTKASFTGTNKDFQLYGAKMACYIYALQNYDLTFAKVDGVSIPISSAKSLLIRTFANMCRTSGKFTKNIYKSIRPYYAPGDFQNYEDQYINGRSMKTALNAMFEHLTKTNINTYAEDVVNGTEKGNVDELKKVTDTKPEAKYISSENYILIGPMKATGGREADYEINLLVNDISTTHFKLCNGNGEEYDEQGNALWSKIKNGNQFYIKYKYRQDDFEKPTGEEMPNGIESFKVKLKQTIDVDDFVIQARMALIGANPSSSTLAHGHQNVAVYGAKKISETSEKKWVKWSIKVTSEHHTLKVEKVNEKDQPIPNVLFDVYKDDTKIREVTTGPDGSVEFPIYESGFYYAQEKEVKNNSKYSAKIQHYPMTKKIKINIDEYYDDGKLTLRLENSRYTNLVIHKTVKNKPDKEIKNAEFKVQYFDPEWDMWQWVQYNDSIKGSKPNIDLDARVMLTSNENEATIFKTDRNGKCYLETIPIGRYRVKEIRVPSAYKLEPQSPNGDGTYTLWENNISNEMTCKAIGDKDYEEHKQYEFTFECADPEMPESIIISGNVFNPQKPNTKKQEGIDGNRGAIYNSDYFTVQNIDVQLRRMEKDGEIEDFPEKEDCYVKTKTDNEGHYELQIKKDSDILEELMPYEEMPDDEQKEYDEDQKELDFNQRMISTIQSSYSGKPQTAYNEIQNQKNVAQNLADTYEQQYWNALNSNKLNQAQIIKDKWYEQLDLISELKSSLKWLKESKELNDGESQERYKYTLDDLIKIYDNDIKENEKKWDENKVELLTKSLIVRFSYDGVDFFAAEPQNTEPNTNTKYLRNGSTSKALEDANARNKLENSVKEIRGMPDARLEQGIKETSSGERYILQYRFNQGNTSQSVGETVSTHGSGISECTMFRSGYTDYGKTRIVNDTLSMNKITADFTLSTEINGEPAYQSLKTEDEEALNNTNVVQLNLGLITREQPDLELTNEIAEVNANINGFTNRYVSNTGAKKGDGINATLTYVQEGNINKFSLYPSDVRKLAGDPGDSRKLQVYVTYKITVANNAETLYSRPNEIAVFYDGSFYTPVAVGTSQDSQTGQATNGLGWQSTSTRRTENLAETNSQGETINYNTIYINTGNGSDFILSPKWNKAIYVTYKVRENVLIRMNSDSNYIPKAKNIAEINAYSTFIDGSGSQYYAGIDKDSAPGNIPPSINTTNVETAEPTDTRTDTLMKRKMMTSKFDDDTGYADEFIIKLKEERILSGQVFYDKSNSGGEGTERTSDGIYDGGNNDKPITGVRVAFYEVEMNGNTLVMENGIPKPKTNPVQERREVEVDSNGKYLIENFVPGYYVLEYKYGDGTTYYTDTSGNPINIDTRDYKSAVISSNNKTAHGSSDYTAISSNNLRWYMSDNSSNLDITNASGSTIAEKVRNAGESEANRRTKYTEVLDRWERRQEIDYTDINYITSDSRYRENFGMDAYTPAFAATVEISTIVNGNYITPEGYHIYNMDFGITERAVQSLKTEKRVSNVKITLANGQVLLDGDPQSRNPLKQMPGLKYIGKSPLTMNGLIDIELDGELIHGATLELTYEIKVRNTGEKDYSNVEYYKFGQGINEVAITSEIYDYVDNNLTFQKDKEGNEIWEVVGREGFVNGDDLKDRFTNGEEARHREELGDKLLVSPVSHEKIQKKNTILKLIQNPVLKATQEATYKLILDRVLSNSNDELTYDNQVEIVRATKSEPSKRLTASTQTANIDYKQLKPMYIGTYLSREEQIGDETDKGIGTNSETVTITPPTGEDKAYTIYIITGVALLLILGVGIILIKKKILK